MENFPFSAVEEVRPVFALLGGAPQGVGPEPTHPLAILAPSGGIIPVGGDSSDLPLVPSGETALVSAGNEGGQQEGKYIVSPELVLSPSGVMGLVERKFLRSFAHSGNPGTGGEECKHGTQRLIQLCPTEFSATAPNELSLGQSTQASSTGNVSMQLVSLQQDDVQPDCSVDRAHPIDVEREGEGDGLPIGQVMDLIQMGVPSEVFFMANGERVSPAQEKNTLAHWEQGQFALGGRKKTRVKKPPEQNQCGQEMIPLLVLLAQTKNGLRRGAWRWTSQKVHMCNSQVSESLSQQRLILRALTLWRSRHVIRKLCGIGGLLK